MIKVAAPEVNFCHTAQKLQATDFLCKAIFNIYLHQVRLHHVTARQQRLVFTLNLHVILACLLRDFALLWRGVDFHFFFSLMFCEHVCVFRERLK